LTEGKKREVKRIFESLKNKVVNLKRKSIGKLRLADLDIKEGGHVFLSKDVIEKLILEL
jgi:16S rRNA U516 pseudouridylate synthase RsuA-like enzyme